MMQELFLSEALGPMGLVQGEVRQAIVVPGQPRCGHKGWEAGPCGWSSWQALSSTLVFTEEAQPPSERTRCWRFEQRREQGKELVSKESAELRLTVKGDLKPHGFM